MSGLVVVVVPDVHHAPVVPAVPVAEGVPILAIHAPPAVQVLAPEAAHGVAVRNVQICVPIVASRPVQEHADLIAQADAKMDVNLVRDAILLATPLVVADAAEKRTHHAALATRVSVVPVVALVMVVTDAVGVLPVAQEPVADAVGVVAVAHNAAILVLVRAVGIAKDVPDAAHPAEDALVVADVQVVVRGALVVTAVVLPVVVILVAQLVAQLVMLLVPVNVMAAQQHSKEGGFRNERVSD